jgi:hypothetical protein
MADCALGKGRGAPAFRAALATGLLAALDQQNRDRRFEIWPPFKKPLRELLAGVHLVERPEPEGPVPPDHAGFALAVLLGQLAQRAPRKTADGGLFKRHEEELEETFAPALGKGNVAIFLAAAEGLGLAFVEEAGTQARSSRRVRLDPEAAEAFLAQPRGARLRRLAEAFPLPSWCSALFSAGERFVPPGPLEAARRLEGGWGPLGGGDWLPFLAAAGLIEEREGAYRASPELRAEGAPRPCGGRWHVQPNLEVLVPPDVPLLDALRLSRVAELVSLDRAAVFRLTPASLRCAADQGLLAADVEAMLAARAAAPPGDVVLRAVRDGVKAPPVARAFEGTFAVLPPAALEALRAHPDFGELVRGEPAPGVVWLADGAKGKLAKALQGQGVDLRFPARREPPERWRVEAGEAALRRLLEAAVVTTEPELAAAVERARRGEAAELAARTPRASAGEILPARAKGTTRVAEPALPQRDRTAEVVALLDRLDERIDRGAMPSLRGLSRPVAERAMREVERITEGRLAPAEASDSTIEVLRHLVGSERGGAASTMGESTRGGADSTIGSCGPQPSPDELLSNDWRVEALRALREQRDLWIQLAHERRPRLVTPHRLARHGDDAQLEARAHDSGDLRAYPGGAISGAAVAGKSAPAHLPGVGAPAVALRAARNDHCPCGSGKKYKHCCLPADIAASGAASVGAGQG